MEAITPICALFVTYHPETRFADNVNRVCDKVAQVIIIDNTPSNNTPQVLDTLQANEKIKLLRNKANKGIATALNQGMNLAHSQGFPWVVTFDQDSTITPDFFTELQAVYQQQQQPEKIAVIGANYRNPINQILGEKVNETQAFAVVKDVITSGSLLSVAVFNKIKGFDDKLFIDMVDVEYCFRARQHGYSIIITAKPLMEHSIGVVESRQMIGKKFFLTNHSPFRRYYIFRNTLYMVKKYSTFDILWCVKMLVCYLPKTFIKACVFEHKKKENLAYILQGIYDGIFSKFSRKVP